MTLPDSICQILPSCLLYPLHVHTMLTIYLLWNLILSGTGVQYKKLYFILLMIVALQDCFLEIKSSFVHTTQSLI